MALITKVGSIKNANYNQSIEYMTKQHEEITNNKGEIVKYEPVYDENGMLKDRENYTMTYLQSDGKEADINNWSRDCLATNIKFKKNLDEDERKAHHYVISYPEEDERRGLTIEKAQRAAEDYCRKNFPGYQCLITTHGDTDNIHTHIVINSVRDRMVEPQPWMTKGENGQIKPSQYEAGGKHTNTPQLRAHLMREIDAMCKEHGFVMENYSDPRTKTKAQSRMEYMHDSVLAAVQKSHNLKELQATLEKDYNLKLAIRGQAIRIYHPDLDKPKRIEHIGLTPHDLTPDLHKYYDMNPKNYEGVHERWADEEKRFQKAASKRAKEEEEGQLQFDEREAKRKGWTNNKKFHYSISRYNEDGNKRTLAEMMMILAYTVITGEIPEYALTEKQRMAEQKWNERQQQIYKPKEQKLNDMKIAVIYARQLKIETPEQANYMSKDANLSPDQRDKAKFVKEQLEHSEDKEYCYGKILKKRQKEIKTYSRKAIEDARKQLEEIHKKEEHKNKKPNQKERDEYEHELAAAENAHYFILQYEGRQKSRENNGTEQSR